MPLDSLHFVLIDRKNFRNKGDIMLRHMKASVERIFIDLKDVDLDSLLRVDCDNVILTGKHLCGGATCMSLRAVENLLKKRPKIGVMVAIATCCQQLCSWESFVGQNCGSFANINHSDFLKISKATSWHVCNRKYP